MSFREKSAWGMALVVLGTGLFYAFLVMQAPQAPVVGQFLPFVLAITVLSIIVQIVIAISAWRTASAPADEREVLAIQKSGHWSGIVLGVSVILAALGFVATGDGKVMFHAIIAGLIVAQFLEYAFQIMLFRRGV